MLNDKTYDVLKWLVWVFLPALTVLIGGLGQLFGWANTEVYTTLIALLTTFLGTVTGISNRNYNKEKEAD